MNAWSLSKEFSSSSGKIAYDIAGQGPPLVLMHGTPWSSFNWRHLIPALARWWTVYFYDLAGYGQSEKYPGQDVSLARQNRVLAGLLDRWELESPFVVGHDFGGTIVLRTHLLEQRDLCHSMASSARITAKPPQPVQFSLLGRPGPIDQQDMTGHQPPGRRGQVNDCAGHVGNGPDPANR